MPSTHRKFLQGACEECGFESTDRCQLHVHHVDLDHANNSPANLRTLCANCHALMHRSRPRPEPVRGPSELRLLGDLAELRAQRKGLEASIQRARAKQRVRLREALERGVALGMGVRSMANAAGVSHELAYQTLRVSDTGG